MKRKSKPKHDVSQNLDDRKVDPTIKKLWESLKRGPSDGDYKYGKNRKDGKRDDYATRTFERPTASEQPVVVPPKVDAVTGEPVLTKEEKRLALDEAQRKASQQQREADAKAKLEGIERRKQARLAVKQATSQVAVEVSVETPAAEAS
jgi:hypothetical protein